VTASLVAWPELTTPTTTTEEMTMGINEDADAAMWQAMDTNSEQDWEQAIALAQEADRQEPIPGTCD